MKISRATYGMMTGLSLGLIMSLSISFILIAMNLGFVPGFLAIWMKSFLTGFAVSVPVSFVAVPLVERALKLLVEVRE